MEMDEMFLIEDLRSILSFEDILVLETLDISKEVFSLTDESGGNTDG